MLFIYKITLFFYRALQKIQSIILYFFRYIRNHFFPCPENNYNPHLFNSKITALLIIFFIALKLFSFSYSTFAFSNTTSELKPENIILLTNLSRQSYGLKLLVTNPLLNYAAQKKADDMAKQKYFSHISPDGQSPWQFIKSTGYKYLVAGENLAVNFYDSNSMQEAWMNSPGHKANILNSNFEELGIGMSELEFEGKKIKFVVEMFAQAAEQDIEFLNIPTVVQQTNFLNLKNEVLTQELKVGETRIKILNDEIQIQVKVEGEPTKVLLSYGGKAVLFYPKQNGFWEANIALKSLSDLSNNFYVQAWDINKNSSVNTHVGFFSRSLEKNYNFDYKEIPKNPKVLGVSIEIKNFEDKFRLVYASIFFGMFMLFLFVKRKLFKFSNILNFLIVIILI